MNVVDAGAFADFVRAGGAMRQGVDWGVQGEPALFARDNLRHYFVATAAAGGGAALIANLRHVASAATADGTANIAVGEGVAVANEHRKDSKLAR